MTGNRRTHIRRLIVAAALIVPALFVSTAPSSASTAKERFEQAKARLSQLQAQFAASVTAYNQASDELQRAEQQRDDAERRMHAAQREAEDARARLTERAVDAYTGMGTQLDSLLQAQDFSEFSDRLTFMGAIAQSDADLATEADAAGQKAEWAAQDYAAAVAQAQSKVAAKDAARDALATDVADQQALANELGDEYERVLAAQEAAAAAREAAETTSGPAPPPLPPPPANATAAAIAVNAARSALGAPYVWGAAGPDAFDCSGLTSWAWAQAGVSIPHSAYAQFTSLPQVPLSQVELGDIIYYGNFGPHVAIYVGGGAIIHARHPGPGGEVQVSSMYGYDQPWGAVRPG
jgi:peptidoglycan DL-endopeptidase CwlO